MVEGETYLQQAFDNQINGTTPLSFPLMEFIQRS